MNEDSANTDDKPKTPPPNIPQSQPASPPPPPAEQGSTPPAAAGQTAGEAPPAPAAQQAVPGADASIVNRIIATFIDGLVAGGINVIVSQIPFLGWFGWMVGMAYLLLRDSLPFLGGQSLGKKALGIQAVTMDGKSLSGNWQPGVVRNIPMVIPVFPLVELIVMLTRMDKPKPLLRLGDEWAKTKVINAPKTAPADQGSSAPPPAQ